MHNPLNPDNLSQSAREHATEHLDERIVRALETAPEPQIPADFAAQVANRLPAAAEVEARPHERRAAEETVSPGAFAVGPEGEHAAERQLGRAARWIAATRSQPAAGHPVDYGRKR